jgi:hypothetical protein
MSDKRVTFEIGPMKLIGANGNVMWEHRGQVWKDLPQAGAVLIQKYMVDVEKKLTQIGDITAAGGTLEEQMQKAVDVGLIPF